MSSTRKLSFRLTVLLVLTSMTLSACGIFSGEPTPTPTNTALPVGDNTWQRIQTSGVLRVGISADYPPFAFYTPDFRVDGFEVALVLALVEKLGLKLELYDITFDGMFGALQVGQVDIGLAAISVTPRRLSLVDFSNPYYTGDASVLANQSSSLGPITSLEQLAGQTIGVQKGSIFESLVESILVAPGLMPSANLYVYGKMDQAIADLRAQRVGVVLLDTLPAQNYMAQGGLKLVAQGLNPQQFSIAIRKGAISLQGAVNLALSQLQQDGTLARLSEQYLNYYAGPVPTFTPQPSPPTSVPGTGCVDGLQFIQDLSFPDFNMTATQILSPGQPFVKGWRVKNVGTCPWTPAYRLIFVQGNRPEASMGGQPTPVTRQVNPGEQYDLYVPMVAPLYPGVYQGLWQMINAGNVPFGQRLSVGIQVIGQATSTPPPTQTPVPNIIFTADRTSIRAGESVTFNWSVINPQMVYFYEQGQPWNLYPVNPTGSRVVWPTVTTVYELRVVWPSNSVEIRQIRIDVTPTVGAPYIARFSVYPDYQIFVGQCVEIQWQVEGSVSNVRLTANNGLIWDGAPVSGRTQHCPQAAGYVNYLIEASGPGGASRSQKTIMVVQPTAPVPTNTPVPPTPVPLPPQIYVFTVIPASVKTGECVNLNWNTGGGTQVVKLKRNGAVVLDNAPLGGQAQDCPSIPGTVTYRLEASNSVGQMIFQEQPVTVQTPPTAPPTGPVITSFTASAQQIQFGQCVVLSWSLVGAENASITLLRNGQALADIPVSQTQFQDCPAQGGQMVYRLSVVSATGSTYQEVIVMVSPEPR